MENFPINLVDLAVVVIILVSALMAFARGLVAEVLSVGAWIGAALIALKAFPFAQGVLSQSIEHPVLANAVAGLGVFVVALAILSLLSHRIARAVRGSALSAVDRSLGFVFGVARGAVVVCLAYLLYIWLVPPPDRSANAPVSAQGNAPASAQGNAQVKDKEPPAWLIQARTRPMLEAGANLLKGLVPEAALAHAGAGVDAAREKAETAAREKAGQLARDEALRRLATPKPEAPKAGTGTPDPTYKDRDRGDLERLIQNSR